jgi:hypothetical protein
MISSPLVPYWTLWRVVCNQVTHFDGYINGAAPSLGPRNEWIDTRRKFNDGLFLWGISLFPHLLFLWIWISSLDFVIGLPILLTTVLLPTYAHRFHADHYRLLATTTGGSRIHPNGTRQWLRWFGFSEEWGDGVSDRMGDLFYKLPNTPCAFVGICNEKWSSTMGRISCWAFQLHIGRREHVQYSSLLAG